MGVKDSEIRFPKEWQKVFVNRSLNMETIKAIGFDMDHTLCTYNCVKFEELAFEETIKKLIAAGYPEDLLKLQFDPDFLIRGLLVDRERGNVLKVDGHKYVKIAYHGHRKLTKSERYSLYNRDSFKAENFLSVDTLFALSEVQIFIEIVEYMERHPNKIEKSYFEVYADLRLFIDLSHRDGTIKSKVIAEPEKYIVKDKYLAKTLLNLKDAGKSLFLLTNSNWEYTQNIMTYLLDNQIEEVPCWRDYFDWVIVGASKPGFFIGAQPFFEVMTDTGLFKYHEGKLSKSAAYHGGSARLLQSITGFGGDEILYVGDHIFGDIMQSKDRLNWRTLLVIEELEKELPKVEEQKSRLKEIHRLMDQMEVQESEIQKLVSMMKSNSRHRDKAEEKGDLKKAHYLQRENDKLREELHAAQLKTQDFDRGIRDAIKERESMIHPTWGELMKVGLERSRFANQMSSFACVYTSRVSNLRYYSPNKKFFSYYENLPHDSH
jgi:5'-nucleotidase